jgi:hypothetical protein
MAGRPVQHVLEPGIAGDEVRQPRERVLLPTWKTW